MEREEFIRACYPRRDWNRLGIDAPSRPWWWWIAFGVYVGVMAIEFWMIYRTVAGWPVDSLSMLQRLAG